MSVLDDGLDDFRPGLDAKFRYLREVVEDDGEAALMDGERDFYRLYRILQQAEAGTTGGAPA